MDSLTNSNHSFFKNLFDNFAENFEKTLSKLDYKVPELIKQGKNHGSTTVEDLIKLNIITIIVLVIAPLIDPIQAKILLTFVYILLNDLIKLGEKNPRLLKFIVDKLNVLQIILKRVIYKSFLHKEECKYVESNQYININTEDLRGLATRIENVRNTCIRITSNIVALAKELAKEESSENSSGSSKLVSNSTITVSNDGENEKSSKLNIALTKYGFKDKYAASNILEACANYLNNTASSFEEEDNTIRANFNQRIDS